MNGIKPGPNHDELRDLVTSEKGFFLLAEAMPQIVWVTRADGWNVYFNQRWVDYTGLTLEESYGHGWNTPFHPDDRQRAWDAWRNAIENHATYSLECRLRKADGTYRWWLIRGVPVVNDRGVIEKWIGTCTDVDDLKTSQEDLHVAKDRLEAALTNMSDALFIVDTEGRLVEFNQAFLAYHRFMDGDRRPRSVAECSEILEALTPDARPIPPEEWATARALRGETGSNVVYSLRRKDTGESWTGSYSFAPIREAAGRIVGAVVVARDITEQVLSHEALRDRERQLRLALEASQMGVFTWDL
ncbi:MAG: PAS domain S-box protein, partial [Gammaproteobacteria bacterium]|nr:PAS domain S-box protein [Gammaproteobacteria bacterium]